MNNSSPNNKNKNNLSGLTKTNLGKMSEIIKSGTLKQLQDNASQLSKLGESLRLSSKSIKSIYAPNTLSSFFKNTSTYQNNLNQLLKNLDQCTLGDLAIKRVSFLKPLMDNLERIKPIDIAPLQKELEIVKIPDIEAIKHKQTMEFYNQTLERQNQLIELSNLMLMEFKKSSEEQSLIKDWTQEIKKMTNHIRWLSIGMLVCAAISTITVIITFLQTKKSIP